MLKAISAHCFRRASVSIGRHNTYLFLSQRICNSTISTPESATASEPSIKEVLKWINEKKIDLDVAQKILDLQNKLREVQKDKKIMEKHIQIMEKDLTAMTKEMKSLEVENCFLTRNLTGYCCVETLEKRITSQFKNLKDRNAIWHAYVQDLPPESEFLNALKSCFKDKFSPAEVALTVEQLYSKLSGNYHNALRSGPSRFILLVPKTVTPLERCLLRAIVNSKDALGH